LPSLIVIEQLQQLPETPGVYLMRDVKGGILYIGKAVNLRRRVKSYFTGPAKLTPKIQRLVEHVNHFDYFLTASEQEALILEMNLIKQHRPHYNARLKDDKSFPYLKIDPKEEWPCLEMTRRMQDNGARYFGPFASTRSLYQTLRMVRRIFPLRTCAQVITGKARPCFQYHIKHCLGPCAGLVDREEYLRVVSDVILFLEGKREIVLTDLYRRMEQAADNLDFERAAILRDQIQSIEGVIEEQKIATKMDGEQDVIAFASDKDLACFQVFFIRNGRLVGGDNFVLQGVQSEEPPAIMASFVQQFYNSSAYIPRMLVLQSPMKDKAVIQKWLSHKRGAPVAIKVPQRGSRKKLVDIVDENARQSLERLKLRQLAQFSATMTAALEELAAKLRLTQPPQRIEGYDISNLQGKSAVGSMVVFEQGRAKPADYRRFRIKTVPGANDYAMLQEIIRRRFRHKEDKITGTGWATLPDLVLIDGGKGQLSAVREILEDTGLADIAVIGLAKENEEIFIPHCAQPVPFSPNSQALYLLERVRDEAHRFALGYHHRVHKKESLLSELDSIRGIGPKRKRALLRQFGSLNKIRGATPEELATVSGITLTLARKLKEAL
jgi:excinuclease ABC subunit C